MKALEADDAVDVVILTGADPAFCAGLDLKELGSGEHDISTSVGDERNRQGPLPAIAKPIIGAINGVAVTGGFELALGLRLPHRVRARPLRRHPRASACSRDGG